MISKKIQFYLYLFLIFLSFFACKKKIESCDKPSKLYEISNLIKKADRYNITNKTDSAFFYYYKAKSIGNPKTDFKKIAYSLLRMAEIQQKDDDNRGSETTAKEAIPFINLTNDLEYSWDFYRILGINYSCTYNFNNSLHYYKKAYQLKTDKRRKLIIKNKIGLVYLAQKKYSEASQTFENILNENEIKKDSLQLSQVFDNLGFAYMLSNNPEAFTILHKALEINLKLKNDLGLGMNYLHLSQFYKSSDPELARKYAQLSYQKFTKIKAVNNRLEALKLVLKTSTNKELKQNSIIYTNLVDSIFEVHQKAKNKYARIKYDSKNEKSENLELRIQKAKNELQIEKQKNRNIISYIVIILSLSLIVVLYYYLTSKVNKDKIEATYKNETRFAKKLHDELANDIYHTMAFAENKNLSVNENKEHLLNKLEALYARTRDISNEKNSIITNEDYVFHLKEMISGFNTPDINLILNGLDTILWNKIDRNKKVTIYRTLQELLVNMKKHSHATLVGINFKTVEKSIIINYTDNGKGVDVSKMSFKNGLHNIETRINSIKGKINIDSDPGKGFKVQIKFPV